MSTLEAGSGVRLDTRLIRIEDTQDLPEAATNLLYGDADLLIVKSAVRDSAMFDHMKAMLDKPIIGALYEHIPALAGLDRVVARYWEQCGYNDYRLVRPNLIPGTIKWGSSETHTDYDTNSVNNMVGPLSLSIGLDGACDYAVQKPAESFRDDDGRFAIHAWRAWKGRPSPSTPRTTTVQEKGDMVFFVNHPSQSYHAVTAHSGTNREAALFDYMVGPSVDL